MIKQKHIIFDMDGTLIDSMEYWESCGARYLESLGLCPMPQMEEELKARTLEEGAAYFIEYYGLSLTPKQVLEGILGRIEKDYEEEIGVKEGIELCLQKMKGQGCSLCVATATNEKLAKKVLEKLGLLSYFEFVITCGQVGQGKTKPTIYLEAAKKLGAAPQEIIVFEDALHCVLTAKKAGFLVAGIYDKTAEKDWKEIEKNSHYCFQNWNEVEQWI